MCDRNHTPVCACVVGWSKGRCKVQCLFRRWVLGCKAQRSGWVERNISQRLKESKLENKKNKTKQKTEVDPDAAYQSICIVSWWPREINRAHGILLSHENG